MLNLPELGFTVCLMLGWKIHALNCGGTVIAACHAHLRVTFLPQVANGIAKYTAGCWLHPGRGMFVLGTTAGELEVYQEKNLGAATASAALPSELEMPHDTEVRIGFGTRQRG